MPPPDADSSSVKPYKPPSHLLGHWTAAELASHYQSFRDSLDTGPELAFERLVGSLGERVNNTARQQQAALDEWREEKNALRESVDQLRLDVAKLNTRIPTGSVDEVRAEVVKDSDDSSTVRLVFKHNVTEKGVSVTGTLSGPYLARRPSGFNWTDIGPCDSTFQSGYVTFHCDSEGELARTPRTITFDEDFNDTPTVVVWLSAIDFQDDLSITVVAINIDEEGFTLVLDAPDDIRLQYVGIAWVAYLPDEQDRRIDSGTVDTENENVWKCPQFSMSGSQPLVLGSVRQPRRFVAVNALELGVVEDLTLNVDTSIKYYPHSALDWSIEAGPPEARLYSVGLSYIVIG